MGYPNQDQAMKDGNNAQITVAPGATANVVLTEYAPFQFGPNKDKTMPKHLGTDAETGAAYEFVGYAFHDAWKQLTEQTDFEPGVTVFRVECLDNGTKYPDYSLSVVTGTATPKKATKKLVDADGDQVPF